MQIVLLNFSKFYKFSDCQSIIKNPLFLWKGFLIRGYELGGIMKERIINCFIFIFDVIKEIFNVRKSNPIDLWSVGILLIVTTFCVTVVLECLSIGVVPSSLQRLIDVGFGAVIRGKIDKVISDRAKGK